MPDPWAVYAIIALALAFDYVNGFHDAANSIATVVSTRVLSPKWAVFWAAFFNFVAFLVFPLTVAGTIGKGIVIPQAVTLQVVAAGLVGAIAWDLITWYYGIPSSSSHALVGGLVGSGLAAASFSTSVLRWQALRKPLIGIALAPTLCLGLGFVFMLAILWLCRNWHPAPLNRTFKKLQLLS